MWGRLLGYNSSLSRVVWGDGDNGFALFGEIYFQRGAGEPIDPVEFYVQGILALPSVRTCHVPGGGKVAEIALEGRIVVGQGIEFGFYPLAIAEGDGVLASIGVEYVQ